MKNNVQKAVFALLSMMLLFSCKSNKELMYLQNLPRGEVLRGVPFSTNEYRLRTNDNLYIQVTSLNPEVNQLFNPSAGTGYAAGVTQQYGTLSAQYLSGYQVDEDGNIEMPIIGEIFLKGKTLSQAKDLLVERVNEYFKEATVTVKLLSYKFTVMGEVTNPGVYYSYHNSCTLLEAISQANGTTDYSSLRKVIIIRETDDRRSYSIPVDLTDKSLLTSQAYYLQPNDVVYVKPDKYKNTRLNASLYALMLSTVSTFIVILKYIGE